jgi:UDP-3-O-[3-hydroxymyristoyl] glucosamine N-acyltransferase
MAGDTILKRGVKLDDQVHIAHNCVIGEDTLIAGQTGLSGTVTVGRGCLFGGQVGVADHVNIGNGVKIGAQSGIIKDAPDGAEIFGYPARPVREALRINAELSRLPLLVKRIRALEARIAELEKKAGGGKKKGGCCG